MATASASTTPAASTSTATAAAAGGPSITNHVLSIPHAQYPHFVTQIVHLRSDSASSLFVHCTSISSSTARALLPTTPSTAPTAEDAAMDAELHAALVAAGRAPSAPAHAVTGSLAADFALAMSPPPHHTSSSAAAYKREPISTPIASFSAAAATSSPASAIAKRIALKLSLPQLLLSLDLPPPLLPAPGRVQSPEDTRALLALEKALRDACASTLTS